MIHLLSRSIKVLMIHFPLLLLGLGHLAWSRDLNIISKLDNFPTINLPVGGTIAIEGDSLVYGLDASSDGGMSPINGSGQPRSRDPFPETIAKMLPNCGTVTNRGYPGDRSVDGLVRWQSSAKSDLVFIMYGGNDALNSARASSGIVSQPTFRFVLGELVERRKRQGAQVVLLSTSPLKNIDANRTIDPYRKSAANIAKQHQIDFIDIDALLSESGEIWTDGVHLNQKANHVVAAAIARMITCGLP